MGKTVLILGASGKIGRHSARAFQEAGWKVRKFNRTTDDMTVSALGADVIVNGLNPPNYHNWQQIIPAITRDVIAAARASGATVLVPGNVYNFGASPGIWDEKTPQAATTRKGQIRIELEQAYRRSGVKTIILRAGNFIDPDRDDDVMGLFHLREIAKGKLTAGGASDVNQAFCFLPDWARAAVMLAERRQALATFEDIPFPGHTFCMDDLRGILCKILARPVKITQFPWWMLTPLAPFWELARELREMRYLHDTPHQLGTEKFDSLLPGFQMTPLQEVVARSLPQDVNPDQTVPRERLAIAAR